MKRFGACGKDMAEMGPRDVFFLRLSLLIVMVKAALKGYPAGRHRKAVVLSNASILHKQVSNLNIRTFRLSTSEHLFRERVKLLSIMAAAIISDEYPLGVHRREAVQDNIDTLCESAFPQKQFKLVHDILKVA